MVLWKLIRSRATWIFLGKKCYCYIFLKWKEDSLEFLLIFTIKSHLHSLILLLYIFFCLISSSNLHILFLIIFYLFKLTQNELICFLYEGFFNIIIIYQCKKYNILYAMKKRGKSLTRRVSSLVTLFIYFFYSSRCNKSIKSFH